MLKGIFNKSGAGQKGKSEEARERGFAFARMLNAPNTARWKLVNYRSWGLLDSFEHCISLRRFGRELDEMDGFSFREYGDGYLWGWMMKNTQALKPSINTHVGTVAAQLLHHAGILGCAEVHTIGLDLMFKRDRHHWYDHPRYQPDRFATEAMFLRREYGRRIVDTRWDMLETAQFLRAVEYLFERDGLAWVDHSDGLLKLEGLRCARSDNDR